MVNRDAFWQWYWHCPHWQRSVLFISIFACIFLMGFYMSMNNETIRTAKIIVPKGKIPPNLPLQRGGKAVPLLPYFGKNHQFLKDISLLTRETGLLLNGVHRVEKSNFSHENADIISVNITGKYTQIRHFLEHIQHMKKRGHMVSFQWHAKNNHIMADCVILLHTDKTTPDRSMELFDMDHDENTREFDNDHYNPFLTNHITDNQDPMTSVGFLSNGQEQWAFFKTPEGKIHTVKTVMEN